MEPVFELSAVITAETEGFRRALAEAEGAAAESAQRIEASVEGIERRVRSCAAAVQALASALGSLDVPGALGREMRMGG